MRLKKKTNIDTNFVDAGKKRNDKTILVEVHITSAIWTLLMDARVDLCILGGLNPSLSLALKSSAASQDDQSSRCFHVSLM